MADPWIKMRVTLHENPHVVRIAYASDAYGNTHAVRIASVVGLLHRTWSLADAVSEDGRLPGYTREALDAIIGVPGWSASMEAVGWLAVTPDGIELCGFDRHNGATAKRRANEAERQRAVRKTSREPYASDAYAPRTPSSSSSISSSSSLSSGSESDAREADPTPKIRRAAKAACTLEDHLAEFEFDALRSDVVEDARRWSTYRRTRKPRTSPWGPSQWRPALRDALRDPDAFRAAVDHSVRQGYQGLIPAKTVGAPAERLTAHEQARKRQFAANEAWKDPDALAGFLEAINGTPKPKEINP